MTAQTFVERVAALLPDEAPFLAASWDDAPELAVYIAAGLLGGRALAISSGTGDDGPERLLQMCALAEEAENQGVSQVRDAIGTDFLPATNAGGYIPRRVFDLFGPRLRSIATSHYTILSS